MTHQEALGKVRKLMAKGQDHNISQEEASTFMAKAQEIMDRFSLQVTDLDYDKNQSELDAEEVRDFGYRDPLDDVTTDCYKSHWAIRLANLVAHHNQCATRYVPVRGFKSGKERILSTKIRIVGRPSDVETSRYLYAFFRNQIEALQAKHCKGQSNTYKGEFSTGCVSTLSEKLAEQEKATVESVKQEQAENSLALVRIDQALVKKEKRREDVEDFFNKNTYQFLAERLEVSEEIAKALFKYDKAKLVALCGGPEGAKLIQDRYDAYNKEEREALKGIKFGRSSTGIRGAGTVSPSCGGYEAGKQAGKSIRLTGAKGGIGRGSAGQLGE